MVQGDVKQSVQIGVLLLVALYFFYTASNPGSWHFLDSVDLIFHEAGHFIFFFLGDFIQMAGGTIMQILVPLVCVLHFYVHKQYYTACLVTFWLGQSFINVSVYARDAVAMQLPLLGGGIHDWNYMLSSLGLLEYTEGIAHSIFFIGIVLYTTATYIGVLVLYRIKQ